jgi:hypothetical protein
MATSENTVLISFNVQLSSKQIVPWTILPVDRTMTVAELCKSIFVGDFTDPHSRCSGSQTMDLKKRAR